MGNYKNKTISIFCIVTIFWIILVVKYFNTQVLNSSFYKKYAKKYYQKEEQIPAKRGTIYDRNMNKLAVDLKFYSYAADPMIVDDKEKVAKVFSDIFDEDYNHFFKKLNKDSRFVWLKRKVDFQKSGVIDTCKFKGIIKRSHYKRLYPYSHIGSQVIGFTNIDNKGISGIERKYDDILSGINGKWLKKVHNQKEDVPFSDTPALRPIDGNDIILTIDLNYQIILEEELDRTIKKFKAKGGIGIIINPQTGEVLAIASHPTYDANNPGNYSIYTRKNRAVTDIFEPGSTFKIVMASAVLENHIYKPDDVFFCENGSYRVYKKEFTDHKKYAYLTFSEIIEYSSNIGAIKITEKLNNSLFYKYIRDFGFGNETGIELLGESKGILHPTNDWSGISKAEITIGYEIGVTAIQMVSAYCAIANGGYLLKPTLVKQIVDENGNEIYRLKPRIIRQIINNRTSHTIKKILEDVVENGTGITAKIDGVKLAGKTGTAQKLSENGKHSRSDYYSSFIGIYPADNPQMVALIMIDSPQGGQYYGSLVAAPAFKNILKKILRLPDKNENLQYVNKKIIDKGDFENCDRLPDVRALTIRETKELLKKFDLKLKISGKGDIIIRQEPVPGTVIKKNSSLYLTLGNELEKPDFVKVPDIKGLSIREAINVLSLNRLNFKIEGYGKIQSQIPEASEKVKPNSTVKLICNR